MTTENDAVPYDKDDPLKLTRPRTPKQIAWAKLQEQVRQQCVEECSSSPLYQARAAKDPDYWKNFSMGCVHLRDEDKGEDEAQ
jgi:hypothetical protein